MQFLTHLYFVRGTQLVPLAKLCDGDFVLRSDGAEALALSHNDNAVRIVSRSGGQGKRKRGYATGDKRVPEFHQAYPHSKNPVRAPGVGVKGNAKHSVCATGPA